MSYAGDDDGAGRPKLSLQPRGSAADNSSLSSAKSSRPNPFGAARPREQVIAEREGKKETEVLKEQIKKDWKPSIVFTEAQREEKKAAEAELAFARSELEKEVDPLKIKAIRDEVALKEKKLDELLSSFEKLAVQSAQSGGTRRSHERTRRDEDRVSSSPVPQQYGGSRDYADSNDGYGNFSRGRGRERDRDSEGTGSYGDTWGGSTRKSGSSQPCYTCGEVGHFSRECPSGGGSRGGGYGSNFGGGRSSGRQCYTCGQEGHFSRECPQGGGGGYGGARGGYGGAGAGGYGGSYDAYGGGNYVNDYPAAGYGGQAGGAYGAGYDDRSAGGYGNAANRGGSYSSGRTEYDSRPNW